MIVYKNNPQREDKEKIFDSFLTKTIILSSKRYYKKETNIGNKEETIFYNDDFGTILDGINLFDYSLLDTVENKLQLNNAINTLSVIEQAVIFLLFKEELSRDEAAKILEICSNSVSRIKLRALKKLKDYLEGDTKNEK